MELSQTERGIARPALVVDQPLERPCDLPLLVPRSAGRRRARFADKFQPGLGQIVDIEKVGMPRHGLLLLDQAGARTLSHR